MTYEHILIPPADIYITRLTENDPIIDEIAAKPLYAPLFDGVTAPSRRRERASEIMLLNELFGERRWTFCHDSAGTPSLTVDGQRMAVSLSHTRSHLAIATASDDCRIGIDIEHPTSRLQRLASGYLSEEEMKQWCSSPARLLMAWTAKEASYKAFRGDSHSLRALTLSGPHHKPVTATFGDTEATVRFHSAADITLAAALIESRE